MISPFSKASSPGSVGSNVCSALTRVTIFILAGIGDPDALSEEAAGVAAAGAGVETTAAGVTASGAAEEIVVLCFCNCSW